MLLNNQLAFAQSSRPLHDSEYQEAKTQGVQLKAIPVAIDGIAVIVNPNLPLQGLTVTQLRDIYLGRITNWKEVGGPNVAIVPYSRDADAGGTVDFFVENLLDKQAFGKPVQIVTNTTLAVRAVEKNLGAIYYASAPSIVPQCQVKPLAIAKQPNEFIPPYQEPYVPSTDCPNHRNQVNAEAFQTGSYPITRRLFVIIKENDQVDQQAGEAYAQLMLSHEGQRLIEEVGFVPLQ
jgi:phosphate transport system substrate-binding protein